MAVLFELYAREYVKEHLQDFSNDSNYKMLGYVSDKANIDVEGIGAKRICVNLDEGLDEKSFYFHGNAVPDIVLKKEDSEEYIILDAKYKDPEDREDRDDRLQILAYAVLYDAKQIGHIFPADKNQYENDEFTIESEKKLKYKMYYIS